MPKNRPKTKITKDSLSFSNVMHEKNLPKSLQDQLNQVMRSNHAKKLNANPTEKLKASRKKISTRHRGSAPLEERLEKHRAKDAIRKELLRVAEKVVPKLTRGWFQTKLSRLLIMTPAELRDEFKNPKSSAVDLWIIRIIREGIESASIHRLEFLLEQLFGKISANLKIESGPEGSSWASMVSKLEDDNSGDPEEMPGKSLIVYKDRS